MGKYNFDTIIDRRGTHAMKYDSLVELYGVDAGSVTPMWIADMEFAVCPEILGALNQRFSNPVLGYSCPPADYWATVADWLRRRHGWDVPTDSMAFVAGVVRGIAFVLNFFTEKGDKVVIQPPVYHPFRNVTEGNGRIVVENPLVPLADGVGYRMDLEGLERIFAEEHPRMMILCNPHNPVGIQWDEATLKEVARLARKYNVIVISDEIHGDLMLGGIRHIPFASVSDNAAAVSITFGAPSKTFNIPGLGSSWMVILNPELRRDFYHWMEVNEFSAPLFTATEATEAAYKHGEPWLEELLSYLEENIEATERFLAENAPVLRVVRPQASFLIWLDCRGLSPDQEWIEQFFLNKAHLALNSGAMFGTQGRGFMRLNIACPRTQLLKALGQLAEAVKAEQASQTAQ
ncbi:MAG: pyridoxal phosphate-dependent aminotransferase [Paramuribaculum sp.]|nr:pyridoxal phosphate-dependent aminotransferase [Paramuribaculum sp.]